MLWALLKADYPGISIVNSEFTGQKKEGIIGGWVAGVAEELGDGVCHTVADIECVIVSLTISPFILDH